MPPPKDPNRYKEYCEKFMGNTNGSFGAGIQKPSLIGNKNASGHKGEKHWKWNPTIPTNVRWSRAAQHFWKRTGIIITEEMYNERCKYNSNCCEICGLPESQNIINGKNIALSFDHDYIAKRWRGLLCSFCNQHRLPFYERRSRQFKKDITIEEYLDETNWPLPYQTNAI